MLRDILMRLFCPTHRPSAPRLALDEAIEAQSVARVHAEETVAQLDGVAADIEAAAGRSVTRVANRRPRDPNIANSLAALKQILERH